MGESGREWEKMGSGRECDTLGRGERVGGVGEETLGESGRD